MSLLWEGGKNASIIAGDSRRLGMSVVQCSVAQWSAVQYIVLVHAKMKCPMSRQKRQLVLAECEGGQGRGRGTFSQLNFIFRASLFVLRVLQNEHQKVL